MRKVILPIILITVLIFGGLLMYRLIFSGDPSNNNGGSAVPKPEKYTKSDPEFLYHVGPGVNLAGAEFGFGDQFYTHQYPTQSLDYYADKGFKVVRLPLLWERFQPEPYDLFEISELEIFHEFMTKAEELGVFVILDLHNYFRHNGILIGTEGVSKEALSDFWVKLIEEVAQYENVVAYGIMNEPHGTNGTWPSVAQYVVDEIRLVDTETLILIGGDNWSSASTWMSYNKDLKINDKSNRIVYEVHVYFDRGSQGVYQCSFDDCEISLSVGEEKMADFISWMKQNRYHGYVGEYGVPSNDVRWNRVMDRFLRNLEENELGHAIWAGGPDWGGYVLSVEPTTTEDGRIIDKPQIELLQKYMKSDEKVILFNEK